MAGQRVRAGLRRLPAARRADGRPARPPPRLHGRLRRSSPSRPSPAGWPTSGATLIAARALQGLGAAILSPAALSLVTTTFAEGAERNTALGVWGAVAAGGGAAGSLLGGVITQTLGLGVGAVDQHADRDRRRAARPDRAARVPQHARATARSTRSARSPSPAAWSRSSTASSTASRPIRWRSPPRCSPPSSIIESRTSNPLVPFAIFRSRSLTGATVDRRPDGRRADRPVLLRHALPAAGPALRPADGRPRLPAAGADDRRLGRPRQPALDQARPEAGARRAACRPGGRPVLVQPRLRATAASSATSCSRASSSPSAWAWRSCR